jgi:hypothetical protein
MITGVGARGGGANTGARAIGALPGEVLGKGADDGARVSDGVVGVVTGRVLAGRDPD